MITPPTTEKSLVEIYYSASSQSVAHNVSLVGLEEVALHARKTDKVKREMAEGFSKILLCSSSELAKSISKDCLLDYEKEQGT